MTYNLGAVYLFDFFSILDNSLRDCFFFSPNSMNKLYLLDLSFSIKEAKGSCFGTQFLNLIKRLPFAPEPIKAGSSTFYGHRWVERSHGLLFFPNLFFSLRY